MRWRAIAALPARGVTRALRPRAGIVWLLGVLVVAGCGGGGHRAHASSGPQRSQTPGPFRWLVPTEGAQPTIAAENTHSGTTAWRLPGPAGQIGGLAHGGLSGYVSAQAVPPALPSGVYIERLSGSNGSESDCLFVVEASAPQPLLAQLPTSTYEAYNAWGGDSLYPGGTDRVGVTGTTQGIDVSYDRPYDSVTGAGQFFSRDVAMVRFLERYGYPVSYTTSESVDRDPGQLSGHRAIIDFGHSEYWSGRQADAFAAARHAGTSLAFLSSDTLAWRVRFVRASPAASQAGEPDHSLVSYKEHASPAPA